MRLHFSIGGFVFRRTTRFRQSIHFSISQVLFLIMCIDAPEWTTNSRSSGLRVDACRHLFSEDVRRILLFLAPLNFKHSFGQLPRCFADTLLLPLCLFLWTILKFWSVGATLMRFTWTNVTERRILVSNFSMSAQKPSWTLHAGSFSACQCSSRRIDFGGVHVLKYETQLPVHQMIDV